jgi:Glutaredoxin-like domain (DUF836)
MSAAVPLELAGPAADELLVFTAPGCSLCDTVLAEIAPLAAELGFSVRLVDITSDAALEAQYRECIPVGELQGRVVFKFRLDEARLRRLWAEGPGGGRGRG